MWGLTMSSEISANEITLSDCFDSWKCYFSDLIKEVEGEDDGNRGIE